LDYIHPFSVLRKLVSNIEQDTFKNNAQHDFNFGRKTSDIRTLSRDALIYMRQLSENRGVPRYTDCQAQFQPVKIGYTVLGFTPILKTAQVHVQNGQLNMCYSTLE
jgi:hypothetical protein